MATPIKILSNTSKHWTNAEKDKRSAAETGLRRDDVKIKMPAHLKGDKTAIATWKKTLAEASELELYDNIDAETLATYCRITSRILFLNQQIMAAREIDNSFDLDTIKEIRQQEALQKQYAVALGLTPESRARLARKRATEIEDDPSDDIYGAM